jgi:hypothetical protein
LHEDVISHPDEWFSTQLETIEAGHRDKLTLILKPDGPRRQTYGAHRPANVEPDDTDGHRHREHQPGNV